MSTIISTPRFVPSEVDLDEAAARTFAAAMREVARCDGEHPEEAEIIDAFEAQLPAGGSTVDLATLTTDAHKDAFLRSLVLVAFADGRVSDEERAVIARYADALSIPADTRTAAWTDVASALLSVFSGVKTYRSQVVALGESMGLDQATIDRILG